MNRFLLMAGVAALASMSPMSAQGPAVIDLGNGIYQVQGAGIQSGATTVRVPQSNTFMVVTPGGNVIVDTSGAGVAPAHKQALTTVNAGPVRAIVLTHAHGDHTGGVAVWREPQTQLITHRKFLELRDYQIMLAGHFARANAAQFAGGLPLAAAGRGPAPAPIKPDVLFDDKYVFDVGGTQIELYHTPGETQDHLTVWIPRLRAAFVGDNFYESFPNLYTLRGTQPRWALDYINSINKVLALDPEIVLPSHGPAIKGREEARRKLTQYRDAIQFVHDATVKGMNDGKDVVTLMREIKLPSHLDVGESYGKLTWSIRGIYEGYIGWFDGNTSTMFGPASQAYDEIVKLAGGPDAVATRAAALTASDPLRALYLTDMALAVDAKHRGALEARLKALQALDKQSTNSNERGWLAAGIRDVERRLKQ